MTTDIVTDLRERFDFALYINLEDWEVLPDGTCTSRSEQAERAIDMFRILRDSVDEIPLSLRDEAERLRANVPELFEETLVYGFHVIGFQFTPTNATEFVEVLNRTVQRDMVSA
jgi:hypothetical protein